MTQARRSLRPGSGFIPRRSAKYSLLSFRNRVAERNLLMAGICWLCRHSLDGLLYEVTITRIERRYIRQHGRKRREPIVPAESRFLSASRFRNDKRECFVS